MEDNEEKIPMLATTKQNHISVQIDGNCQDGGDDIDLGDMFQENKQGVKIPRQKNSVRHTAIMKTNMHHAAEVGDARRLRQLIEERPKDMSHPDEGGYVPLHLAAKGVHLECCKILLDASIKEVNIKDKLGNTPLLLAATTGDASFNISELLVSKGASVKLSNRAKMTALHLAAQKGNTKTLRLLIQQCSEGVHARETEQQTPLHMAARNGRVSSCRLLAEAGSDLEAKDVRGYTALHWAAKYGFTECCRELLKLGSEVNCIDNGGNTPLHLMCALTKEKPDCAQVLLEYGASPAIPNRKGETPFHAVQHSPFEVKRVFKTHPGIDLFVVDSRGRTALHWAAERKKSSHTEFVLDIAKSQDIDMKQFVNMADIEGKTALHVAIEAGDLECCRALVKAGADGNLVLGARGTSLHLAAEKGLKDLCGFLIARGIKTDTRNNSLMTPLHLAAKNGHSGCCEILLKRGVPWAAQDEDGLTALHHAAREQHADCCKIIVALQPSAITRTDKAGQTPLHLAVERNCLKCCQALVTPRSNVWFDSGSGSPVKLAYERGFHMIFDFLLKSDKIAEKQNDRDLDFRNVLDDALEKIRSDDSEAHRHIAESIIHSSFWEESLKSYGSPGDLTPPEKQKNGNLRLLVRHLPDVAKVALDKCMAAETQPKVRYLDQEYFLGVDPMKSKKHYTPSISGEQLSTGVQVTGVDRVWREDHVLAWMVRYGRLSLLNHPLVTLWLDYKWETYVRHGLSLLIFFACLLAILLTVFTAISWDWSFLKHEYNYTQEMVCGPEPKVGPEVENMLRREGKSALVLSYVILTTIGLWVVHDLYRGVKLRLKYFTKENTAFLLCAAASVAFVGNFTDCSWRTNVRENFQWEAGLVAMFAGWIHVFLLTRRMPFCSPFLFRLRLLIIMFFKVFVPIAAVGFGVILAYWIGSKGELAYNQNWSKISRFLSHPAVSVGFLVVVTVILCILLMEEGKKKGMDKYLETRRVSFVEMILNFDLLYPCLRNKYYVTWLPKDKRNGSSCDRVCACFPFHSVFSEEKEAAKTEEEEKKKGEEEKIESESRGRDIKRIEEKIDELKDTYGKQAAELMAFLRSLKLPENSGQLSRDSSEGN